LGLHNRNQAVQLVPRQVGERKLDFIHVIHDAATGGHAGQFPLLTDT
jgi:hypothetical protein